jgi:hypothetical protein
MKCLRERLGVNEKSLLMNKNYNAKKNYYFKQRRSVGDRDELREHNAIASLQHKFSKPNDVSFYPKHINPTKSQES